MLSPPPPPATAPEQNYPEEAQSEKPSVQPPLANEPIDVPAEGHEIPTPTTTTSSTPSQLPTPRFTPPAPTATTTTTTHTPSPTAFLSEPDLPSLDIPSVIPTKSKKKPKTKPTPIVYKDGLTVTLESESDFCLFLPSSPGNKDANGGKYDRDAIGSSEKNARAFCTKQDLAPGAGPMPPGFIKSAVFKSTDDYVQVDGTINNAAYHLSDQDGGGQYDDHGSGSPPESHCKNYPYYVSLIEPDMKRFCIRCCKSYAQCNAGRSEYGCDSVLRDRK
ncbi:hypothetical protein BJV82DRAFT_585305 [Fennellomyces sp. T-0311]|nr:hypothetical protein BJV82DRAFT_585305 [Fennellomyces sp. T-0311]